MGATLHPRTTLGSACCQQVKQAGSPTKPPVTASSCYSVCYLQVSVAAAGGVAGPSPVEAAAAELWGQWAGQLLQGQITRTCQAHTHVHI